MKRYFTALALCFFALLGVDFAYGDCQELVAKGYKEVEKKDRMEWSKCMAEHNKRERIRKAAEGRTKTELPQRTLTPLQKLVARFNAGSQVWNLSAEGDVVFFDTKATFASPAAFRAGARRQAQANRYELCRKLWQALEVCVGTFCMDDAFKDAGANFLAVKGTGVRHCVF